MIISYASVTITATAGNSFRAPLVALEPSLYQERLFVRYLHAPPSESLRVSYTNISTAVSDVFAFIFQYQFHQQNLGRPIHPTLRWWGLDYFRFRLD